MVLDTHFEIGASHALAAAERFWLVSEFGVRGEYGRDLGLVFLDQRSKFIGQASSRRHKQPAAVCPYTDAGC